MVVADEYLQSIADSLLYLFDYMPPVSVWILNIEQAGCDFKPLAEAHGQNAIVIDRCHYENGNLEYIHATILHELTHIWVNFKGRSTNLFGGHNIAWFRKAIELKLDFEEVFYWYPGSEELYREIYDERNCYHEIELENGTFR